MLKQKEISGIEHKSSEAAKNKERIKDIIDVCLTTTIKDIQQSN